MDEAYRRLCLKCGNKVYKDLKHIDNALPDLVLTVVSYKCTECGHINPYKDMFYGYKQEN